LLANRWEKLIYCEGHDALPPGPSTVGPGVCSILGGSTINRWRVTLRRKASALRVVLRAACGCLAVLVLPASHAQDPTDAHAVSLEAADQAARELDYETALARLGEAAKLATAAQLPALQRRQALYEKFLAMDDLLELAAGNEGAMVGIGATRGGKALAGLVQLFELGVTPGAAVGNRVLDKGRLSVQPPSGPPRSVRGDEIAQLQVQWQEPDEAAGHPVWSIASLRIVLQSGEEVVGRPSWVMCMGSMSFRPAGAEDDTDVLALPIIGREFDPNDLAAELLVIGAPPGLRPEGEIGDVEEAAATAAGGPLYREGPILAFPRDMQPLEPTPASTAAGPTDAAEDTATKTQPPAEETEHE